MQVEALEAEVVRVQTSARQQVARARQGAEEQRREVAQAAAVGDAAAAEHANSQHQALLLQVAELQASLTDLQRSSNEQDDERCTTIAHLKKRVCSCSTAMPRLD